jgi:hypothetical protein
MYVKTGDVRKNAKTACKSVDRLPILTPLSARRSAKPYGATLRCAPPALALQRFNLKGGQLFEADPGQRFGAD